MLNHSYKFRCYAGIGSRATPPDVLKRIAKIAARLEVLGWTLRSGAAQGADTAFELAVTTKEIYLPWPGFNGRAKACLTMPSEAANAMAENIHPAWKRLSWAAQRLHARNMHQILGAQLNVPVTFVLCWTSDGCESAATRTHRTGGTGQAIALASAQKIPVFNLAVPNALDRLAALLSSK